MAGRINANTEPQRNNNVVPATGTQGVAVNCISRQRPEEFFGAITGPGSEEFFSIG